MNTVTIPKTKYQILEKRAELYSRLLEKEEENFPIELYSADRIREFLREDKVSTAMRRKVQKLLRTR